jgi:putative ABC transport system ATP-binding protein
VPVANVDRYLLSRTPFQSFNLLQDLTVRDNVEMPLRYRGLSAAERHRRVDASLYRVGLSERANYYPPELSGGQQQRVAIARALAGSPRILLADEPTGNLDEEMGKSVMDLLQELHRGGATIVVVTHSAEMRGGRSGKCASSMGVS